MTSEQILGRLKTKVGERRPIMIASAGSGLVAKLLERAGVDCINTFSGARLRANGMGTMSMMWPILDSNRQTLDYTREDIMPALSGESSGHTLQTTSLVHEAYLRLIGADVNWEGSKHFMRVAARAMRRVLVDHARSKGRAKRGGDWHRLAVPSELVVSPHNDHDVLAVDDALTELSKLDPRQALIVELRFFGGMTAEEVANYLGVSKPTVDRHWRVARAWLRKQFSEE